MDAKGYVYFESVQAWADFLRDVRLGVNEAYDLAVLQAFDVPPTLPAQIEEISTRVALLEAAVRKEEEKIDLSPALLVQPESPQFESSLAAIKADIEELRVLIAMAEGALPDASGIQRGAVNTTSQRFAGSKNFDSGTLFVDAVNDKIGIGTETPGAKCAINGGLHVGGDSDPGDNAVLVDGAFGCNGATVQTPYASGGPAAAVAGTATEGGFGFVSEEEFNAFIAAVNAIKDLANNIRAAQVNNGIMS